MCECGKALIVVDAIHVRCDNEVCEKYDVLEMIVNF
jgi:hypothetical protein